jgi:hypothetical protein
MKTNIFKSDYENLRKVVEEINMRVN